MAKEKHSAFLENLSIPFDYHYSPSILVQDYLMCYQESYGGIKLEGNEQTREQSYGETKLESNEQTREQSYGETKLETNEKTRKQNYRKRKLYEQIPFEKL